MFHAVHAALQRLSTLTVASVVALSSLATAAPLFFSQAAIAAAPQVVAAGSVVINEVMANPATGNEWVELYNTTNAPIDIGQWQIRDNGNFHNVPNNTTIAANGFYVGENSNTLENSGETITLEGHANSVINTYTYGTATAGQSFARETDGSSNWVSRSGADVTKGLTNNLVPTAPVCTEDTLRDAITAAAAGDTVTLCGDITVTQELVINKNITLDGDGHTIMPNFSSAGSNNSVVEIIDTNAAITDLTIDGTNSTSLHGINIYEATVTLNDVTSTNNDKSGVVVNGSTVIVNNITTGGNGWHGINVDLGSGVTSPAVLTINGTSAHTDVLHIYVDDTTKDVSVIDTNHQYTATHPGYSPSDRLYTLGSLTAPSLTAPNSDAIVTGNPIQKWTHPTPGDVHHYIYESYSDNTLTGQIYTTTTTNTQRTVGGTQTITFYWRVAAVDDAGTTAWSELRKLTIDNTAPAAPVHQTPTNNAYINYNDFYFNWTDVTGAVEYEFQSSQNASVDSDGVLNDGVWNNKLHAGSDRNFLTSSEIHSYGASGVWYWQVRAIDAAGNTSAWTTPWKLAIDLVQPLSALDMQPEFVNGTINITGSVSDLLGLSHYNLSLYPGDTDLTSGDSLNSARIAVAGGWTTSGATYVTGDTDVAVSRTLDTTLLADGEYQVRLGAADLAGNKGVFGESVVVISFIVDNTAPASFNLLTPEDNEIFTSSSFDKFDWEDATDANVVTYSILLYKDGDWMPSASDLTTSEWTPTSPLEEGSYGWKVWATDAAGNETWTEGRSFVIDNTVPTPEDDNGRGGEDDEPVVTTTPPTGSEAGSVASRTTTNDGSRVLASSSNTSNSDSESAGEVKAADTTNEDNAVDGAVDEDEQKLIEDAGSVLDYWWIVLLAVLGLFWFIAAKRRKKDEE